MQNMQNYPLQNSPLMPAKPQHAKPSLEACKTLQASSQWIPAKHS
jgi:hypothetical protein